VFLLPEAGNSLNQKIKYQRYGHKHRQIIIQPDGQGFDGGCRYCRQDCRWLGQDDLLRLPMGNLWVYKSKISGQITPDALAFS
jgi:hypothetical protein